MRRWWLVLVLLIVVVAVGAALRGRNRTATTAGPPAGALTPAPVPVEVAEVERGDVVRTVEVSGTVVSARTAEIYSKLSGRVARVLVTDGARVRAGQVLVELDATDQHTEVAQAEAAEAAAASRLALLEAGLRPQERQVARNALAQAQTQVKAAETQVALAQAALRVAEDNLRRYEQLFRDGAVAQAQVDQARLQTDQARAQLQAAQAQLEAARTAVDTARQQVEISEAGPRAEDLRAARAQVAQARAVVAMAKQRLANTAIRAPFDGRVTGMNASVGDYIVSGDFAGRSGYVAVVYDDRAMEVEVRIGERDLGLIRVGQRASLRLETAPGAPASATVRIVTPAADPSSRTATVRLRLAPGAQGAVPGTFARGEIIVEQRTGVLLIPTVAVLGGERPTVRVAAGEVVEVRPVTLGLVQGKRVEVRAGLAVGEQVVVLGPETLAAGAKIRVVNR